MFGKIRDLTKRAGLVVTRPILNGDAWLAWAEKSGIPNLVGADEMHITVLSSSNDVMLKPQLESRVINTGYRCAFKRWGPTSDGLAVVWDDWSLAERAWLFQEAAGQTGYSYEFLAVMVLSTDLGDFELTAEMLSASPEDVVLGPERFGSLPGLDTANIQRAAPVEVDASIRESAKALLEAMNADPEDTAALWALATDRPVSAERLNRARGLLESSTTIVPAHLSLAKHKLVEGEIVQKNLEERIAYGWASVSVEGGEMTVDWHDDKITTKALKQMCHGLIRNARAGNVEHEGGVIAEIVEALVFTADLQRALGINLDKEGLFIGMHVPDEEVWKRVLSGELKMFSIGCRAIVREEEEA